MKPIRGVAATSVTVALLSALLFTLPGCGEGEGHEPHPEWVPLWNPSQGAICNVKVSGGHYSSKWGTKKVETEYLPRVLWCEVGVLGRNPEFLKAMAIAARTFLYNRLSWRRSMRNSTDDQVYYSGHCKSRPHQAYYDAVSATSGMVMLKSNGSMHHGYYRAGRSSCSAYGNCHGQPCLGQKNAAKCAKAGYGWRAILDKYYETPRIHQASGSCTSGSGEVGGGETGPQSCYFGGVRGECKETSETCDGSFKTGLCNGPTDTQCCLPDDGSYGTCTHEGTEGKCQLTSQTCDGEYKPSHCPGTSAIQCCVKLPEPGDGGDGGGGGEVSVSPWGQCDHAGRQGVCQKTSTACDGSFLPNLCPGGNDVRCCISWGSCTHDGAQGQCQQTSTPCGGSYQPGLCPGPSDVRCCVE